MNKQTGKKPKKKHKKHKDTLLYTQESQKNAKLELKIYMQRICKVKINMPLTKHHETKYTRDVIWAPFVLAFTAGHGTWP